MINFFFLLTNTYSREKVMQALGFHSNDSFRHHVLIVVLKWWNQKIVSQCHFQPYWGIHLQKSLFFHTRMKIFIIVKGNSLVTTHIRNWKLCFESISSILNIIPKKHYTLAFTGLWLPVPRKKYMTLKN